MALVNNAEVNGKLNPTCARQLCEIFKAFFISWSRTQLQYLIKQSNLQVREYRSIFSHNNALTKTKKPKKPNEPRRGRPRGRSGRWARASSAWGDARVQVRTHLARLPRVTDVRHRRGGRRQARYRTWHLVEHRSWSKRTRSFTQ